MRNASLCVTYRDILLLLCDTCVSFFPTPPMYPSLWLASQTASPPRTNHTQLNPPPPIPTSNFLYIPSAHLNISEISRSPPDPYYVHHCATMAFRIF